MKWPENGHRHPLSLYLRLQPQGLKGGAGQQDHPLICSSQSSAVISHELRCRGIQNLVFGVVAVLPEEGQEQSQSVTYPSLTGLAGDYSCSQLSLP